MNKKHVVLATLLATVHAYAIPVTRETIPSGVSASSAYSPQHSAGNLAGAVTRDVPEAGLPFPTSLHCTTQPVYRHRADGQPGREISLVFAGGKLYVAAELTVVCDGKTETVKLPATPAGRAAFPLLLPTGVGVAKNSDARITLRVGTRELTASVAVPARRQWTVFLYPHSHVDIGYTQPQEIVEKITVRNLNTGMEIADASKRYPAGARYVWNTEAVWAAENFLKQATPAQKETFVAAVKAGRVGLDGSFAHLNTTACADEELLRYFQGGLRLRKLTGTPVDTLVQMDVPGASWGLIQAAAQCGIRGFLDFPNGFDRIGSIHSHFQNPFWWVAPDGKSRVLYIQGPTYGLAWDWKAWKIKPSPYPQFEFPAGGWVQDYPAVMDRVRTADPTRNFIPLDYLLNETAALEKAGLPYDYFTMTWSMSDNSIPDADLPDAVKAWNKTYAYPRLVIASAHTIVDAYIKKFGDIIPEKRGDLAEYWTDGLGTGSKCVGYNRLAKERLIQTEILQSMLGTNPDATAFNRTAYDAWRWILLGSEHTWGYYLPEHPISKKIEATKAGYFENAKAASETLLAQTLPQPTESQTLTVYNTLSWSRSGLVTLPAGIASLANTPIQKLTTGETVFLADNIPPLGARVYQAVTPSPALRRGSEDKGMAGTGQSSKLLSSTGTSPVGSGAVLITPTTLENTLVKVTLDPQTGDIVSLVDKRTRHDFADSASPYALNSFRYLRGADPANNASKPTDVKISIKENGPVLASLRVESKAEGCHALSREIRLLAGQPQVEIINTVDKIATRNKEGIHFGFAFNIPDGVIRMDIPWGVMNPLSDLLPGANRNWLAFQRWIDISNAGRGVTWTAIEAPVVEIGGITANILGGANHPRFWRKSIEPTQTIVSWALNNHWHTNFPLEQGGAIPFHYAILPHGAYDPVIANRFGLEQNRPLLAVRADKPAPAAKVAIDNPRVFLSTLKPGDNGKGTIVRLRSLSDKPETVTLSWPAGAPKSITTTDATEQPGKSVTGNLILPPYGVSTLRIHYK